MPGPFQTLQSAAGGPSGAPAQALTDEQIAQLRQYAGALQGNKQPVQHWLQGASNLTGDIVGALQQRKADQTIQDRINRNTNEVQTAANNYYSPVQPPSYAPPQGTPHLQQPTRATAVAPVGMSNAPYAQPNTDWSSARPIVTPGSGSFGLLTPSTPQVGDLGNDPSMMSTG